MSVPASIMPIQMNPAMVQPTALSPMPPPMAMPSQVQEAQALIEQAEKDAAAAAIQVIDALASHCWREFESAREAKQTVHNDMLKDLRQRNGEYEADIKALIDEMGGSDIYIRITAQKCRYAVSMLQDAVTREARPFACEPTPIASIPAEIQQAIQSEVIGQLQRYAPAYVDDPAALRERIDAAKTQVRAKAKEWAQQQAKYNEDLIDDQLVEGGFYDALENYFDDLCGLRGGFLKGPTIRRKKCLAREPGVLAPVVKNEPRRTYSAPSPFDIYPAPSKSEINDGKPMTERLQLSRHDLYDLIGVDGFKEDAIREALREGENGALKNWWWGDVERARLENKLGVQGSASNESAWDCMEHYTTVSTAMLADWGIPEAELLHANTGMVDREKPVNCIVWIMGRNRVIGVRLNEDPLGHLPYFKAGYSRVRGSFWYEGVPALLRDVAAMCNAAVRALATNMAASSGYIQEVQTDRLAPGEKVKRFAPYSVVQTVSPKGNAGHGPAVYFHQPANNAQAYMAVFQFFASLADKYLGLPDFLGGSSPKGAGETSSGLSQLRDLASRAFGYVVTQVDGNVEGIVSATHTDMLMYPGDYRGGEDSAEQLTGDLKIRARGSKALANRDQKQVRLNELVASLNNPTDVQIMGPEGRMELLRAALKDFDGIDLDRMLPTRDEVLMQMKTAAAAAVGLDIHGNPLPQPTGPGGQATLPDGSKAGGADMRNAETGEL